MKETIRKKKLEWKSNNSKGLNEVTIVDLNEETTTLDAWVK